MSTGKRLGAVIAGLGLVLATAVMSIAVTPPHPGRSGGAAPWSAHLRDVDDALRAHDVKAALTAWRAAQGAARASRRWEALADSADAYLRIARATGTPDAGAPRARGLYLSALFRARDARSPGGLLRIASAFQALGDHEVAAHAHRLARPPAGTP